MRLDRWGSKVGCAKGDPTHLATPLPSCRILPANSVRSCAGLLCKLVPTSAVDSLCTLLVLMLDTDGAC
jgi:hypothetical protein